MVDENLKGKNWVATMMLCWTLGAFGAHRFYTGKTNSAWVMAVLTLTGCFSFVSVIWAVIDGLNIALGHYTCEDGSELYERIDWLGYIYIAFVILGFLCTILYFLFTTIFIAGLSSLGSM